MTAPARSDAPHQPALRTAPRRESLALRMFLAFSPRIRRVTHAEPPASLAPFEVFSIPRPEGSPLQATWYPTSKPPRGVVLFLHPWVGWGQTYFHRHGRIEAVREAGYHAITVDIMNIGGQDKRPPQLFDIDVQDALAGARQRAAGLPVHVWGVSAGGYWAHMALARDNALDGVFFEEVAVHLLEWLRRMAPAATPVTLLFRLIFAEAYRFMDIRHHASSLQAKAIAYVSGDADRSIRVEETKDLASRAKAECSIIAGAAHLEVIKRDSQGVLDLALATFARAERQSRG